MRYQEGVKEQYRGIMSRVREAEKRANREPESVQVVAVTKGRSAADILALYDLGHRDFGESRVQDWEMKAHTLPTDICWHFIGKLQSNKAKKVGTSASVIHSLEGDSQLRELAKVSKLVRAYVEVNVGLEPQKSGVLPDSLEEFLSLTALVPNMEVLGLMTIGPRVESAEESRRYFRELACLAKSHDLPGLSMGMSSDFEIAIEEGATAVRIGSLFFS